MLLSLLFARSASLYHYSFVSLFRIVAGSLLAGVSLAMAHISFLALLQFINGYRVRLYGIYSLRIYAPAVIYPATGVVLSVTAGLLIGFTNPVISLSYVLNGGLLIVMYAFVLISVLAGHI
ncbi:MAG: hypothetical protein N4J56_006490 [Chroococcidiopsis sp. SAG 2025]|uniref:hypothetical protein n=1 Tax=Chroococcidiopsis sp. SAG 2025 TaxID=171389 RepID=UPI002936D7F4|nr:hypothetical protein [Chroococcidiopsis sp. SAG 2025]MDV2996785.1 hypothetical protein [Chroococcidiopsis sp. SAG 2025]